MNGRPFCHTLSNALEISKNTPLTSAGGLLSKLVCNSRIMARSWAIHKSPGRKLTCEGVKGLLLIKWLNKEL